MKNTNFFLFVFSLFILFVFPFCKKETVMPYAHLIGNWKGIETSQHFINDSLDGIIKYNLNLEFYADGTGVSINNNNSVDSLVWSYNDKRKEIDVRIKSVLSSVVYYNNYPFSIIENKDNFQKWSYFHTYLSSGKIRKFMYTWEINKK